MEVLGFVIEIILSLISTLVFIIILWDHIIDDRRLTKRVQRYYEDLENLVFHIFERDYYRIYKVLPELGIDEKESSEKSHKIISQRCIYFKNIVLGEMKEYYRYLGFTRLEETSSLEASTIKKVLITKVINEEGYSLSFRKKNFSLNHHNYSEIDAMVISDTNLEFIKEFLKSVRIFWKEKYSKFLVRPKLKAKKDFNILHGFKNPIEKFRKEK